ncbi:hypothetical protein M3D75_02885 [Microbacterium enclense]|uniref:hypothetical protein n=1 Tax=Microbacterium enclense TaxID=993073 RepID=UPI0021A68299|nr:hypothetical protein [Microbacterium enclense]MCT2085053.1 hypothetical protein [Microbacterium enclense]
MTRIRVHTKPPRTAPTGDAVDSGAAPRRRPRMFIDGYQLQPATIGWNVRLRHAWTDGTPSLVGTGSWWTLTESGAHRKAKRLIAHDRRQRAREAASTEYDA